MPQLCTVCSHPDSHLINLSIIKGELSNRRIAAQYELTERAIRYHRAEHLPLVLAESQALQKQEEADEVLETYYRSLKSCLLLLEACEEYLADPDRPGKLTLDARASHINIIYDDFQDCTEKGKPRRKRATLNYLLMKLERGLEIDAIKIEHKQPAPSELLPKVIAQLRPLAELKAMLEGRLNGNKNNGSETHITIGQLNVLVQKYEAMQLNGAGIKDMGRLEGGND